MGNYSYTTYSTHSEDTKILKSGKKHRKKTMTDLISKPALLWGHPHFLLLTLQSFLGMLACYDTKSTVLCFKFVNVIDGKTELSWGTFRSDLQHSCAQETSDLREEQRRRRIHMMNRGERPSRGESLRENTWSGSTSSRRSYSQKCRAPSWERMVISENRQVKSQTLPHPRRESWRQQLQWLFLTGATQGQRRKV